jgi:hypothetical protein
LCKSENSAEALDDGAIKQSLFQRDQRRRNEKPRCDNMPRSGDEWFQKSDEWYAAASLFIEAPFGSHADILCFPEENAQKRYTIWNSTIAAAHI